MKFLNYFFLSAFFMTAIDWHYNLDEAKQLAHKENKFILLTFSGSDWCGPCIRMHKEIFNSEPFLQLASVKLVLVNADFPRLKKNQLSAAQQDLNNAMADKYNSKGLFPYTVLLDADGKVLKDWEGLPPVKPAAFCEQLQEILERQQ